MRAEEAALSIMHRTPFNGVRRCHFSQMSRALIAHYELQAYVVVAREAATRALMSCHRRAFCTGRLALTIVLLQILDYSRLIFVLVFGSFVVLELLGFGEPRNIVDQLGG